MYRKRSRPLFVCLLSAMALITLLSAAILTIPPGDVTAEETAVASPFITTYPLPNQGEPRSLIQANDQFWFTAPGINAIGKLVVTSTVDYAYTFYTIPTANSFPYDLTWDGEHVWFTELAGNQIGKLHPPSGNITEYAVLTANSEPTGISVTADGVIWFTERAGNNLTSFDPATETFTEHLYPRPDALLEDVVAQPTSNLVWFTAPGVTQLGWYNKNTEQFDDVPTSSFGVPPYTPSQVDIDNRGDPWVSTHQGRIGRFAASTVQLFRWYRVGPEDSEIDGLIWTAEGDKNRLWFTESNTGYGGQLTTKADGGTLYKSRFPITEDGGQPFGVMAETNGAVWIADSNNHMLLSWSPPYAFFTYLPTILAAD